MKRKTYKLNLWERLCLHFVKPKIGYDFGNDEDKAMIVVYKIWRGKYYVVDQYEVGKDI